MFLIASVPLLLALLTDERDAPPPVTYAETITVTAPSRRQERAVDAPAAVSVVSEEQIESQAPSGQLPQTLVGLTGVDSVQSGLYDFNFSTRGFNRPLNRRVLTLVDGRDTSFAFLGAQEWGAMSLPMDQYASAELVRGPRSALYGANAYSGVISFISKRPRDAPGGFLRLTAGELETSRAEVSQTGAIDDRWSYRVAASYRNGDDFAVSRIGGGEYAGLVPDAVPIVSDTVRARAATVRIDRELADSRVLTVEAGTASVDGAMFVLPIGRVQDFADRPWARVNFNTPSWNLLAYYDRRDSHGQVLTSGALVFEDSYNARLEWQGTRTFGAKTAVVAGASFNQQGVDDRSPSGAHSLLSDTRNEQQTAAFAQGDVAATERLRVIAAARYDGSSMHPSVFSPKLALQYALTPSHGLRLNYSAGFQSPNYAEIAVRVPVATPLDLSALEQALAPVTGGARLGFDAIPFLAIGNTALRVEKVRSLEAGYSGTVARHAFVTVDAYRSVLTDFITEPAFGLNPAYGAYTPPASLSPDAATAVVGALRSALPPPLFAGLSNVDGRPAFVLSFTNAGRVTTHGVEAGADLYLGPRWSADANYSWFHSRVDEPIPGSNLLPNTPEHKAAAGVRYRGERWSGSARYRWVDAFAWESGLHRGTVPSYSVVDLAARLAVAERWELALSVANALDEHHYELFGGDILRRVALVSATVRWGDRRQR